MANHIRIAAYSDGKVAMIARARVQALLRRGIARVVLWPKREDAHNTLIAAEADPTLQLA